MDYNNRFRETLDRNAEFGERKGDAEYDVSEKNPDPPVFCCFLSVACAAYKGTVCVNPLQYCSIYPGARERGLCKAVFALRDGVPSESG